MSIPLKIVTGFLGSGKTSVLQHAASTKFPRGRIAIFIREYLDTPFDRDRVVGSDHDVHIVAGEPSDWSITVRNQAIGRKPTLYHDPAGSR